MISLRRERLASRVTRRVRVGAGAIVDRARSVGAVGVDRGLTVGWDGRRRELAGDGCGDCRQLTAAEGRQVAASDGQTNHPYGLSRLGEGRVQDPTASGPSPTGR